MKKKYLSLALALMLIFSLAACGGSGSKSTAAAAPEFAAPESAMPESEFQYAADSGVSGAAGGTVSPVNTSADKIIYSADAGIETKEYDKCIDAVYALIDQYGGFLESSSIGGTSYYGRGGRSASFTIRIPSAQFAQVTGTLSDLGNVTYCRTYSQNVTTEYIDVQSRLDSYRIQEERLLAMLEKAEELEDMLTIEEHLAEVRYNIESYTTQLNYLDSQVSYSTLELSVDEVVEYSPDQSVTQSFGSRMHTAFTGGISSLVSFLQDLILFLLRSWYVLIVLAVILIVVIRRVRRELKKQEEKRADGGK